jgi:hypothetical protein
MLPNARLRVTTSRKPSYRKGSQSYPRKGASQPVIELESAIWGEQRQALLGLGRRCRLGLLALPHLHQATQHNMQNSRRWAAKLLHATTPLHAATLLRAARIASAPGQVFGPEAAGPQYTVTAGRAQNTWKSGHTMYYGRTGDRSSMQAAYLLREHAAGPGMYG